MPRANLVFGSFDWCCGKTEGVGHLASCTGYSGELQIQLGCRGGRSCFCCRRLCGFSRTYETANGCQRCVSKWGGYNNTSFTASTHLSTKNYYKNLESQIKFQIMNLHFTKPNHKPYRESECSMSTSNLNLISLDFDIQIKL